MKNNFYKYGAATLIGVSLLLAAGCQNNNTQSSSSSKAKSSVVKIEKKSKSNKASSKNKQSSINEESSQSSTKSVEKKNDKLPTAAELMKNVSAFNEGNFDIRLNYATIQGYDTGVIQESPRIVHYKFNGGMSSEIWTTDKDVYTLEGDKWTQAGQTYKYDRFDPITNVPTGLINQMKVTKTAEGYKATYQGNSQEIKELMEKYIVCVASAIKWNPWGDQDFTSATLTYTFNKQKQLTGMNYEWSAGSNKGTASYTNINQQQLSVPKDVIEKAAQNPDSVDNQNKSVDSNDDDDDSSSDDE